MIITFSYTPCRDTAISPRGGTVQLNKLPQTTIIIIIIDGTIRFIKAKIQTDALGSICVRRKDRVCVFEDLARDDVTQTRATKQSKS